MPRVSSLSASEPSVRSTQSLSSGELRSSSLASASLLSAPALSLDAGKIVPKASAAAEPLAKTDVAALALDVAGNGLLGMGVADTAVAVNQLGLVQDSGLDATGTSVTAYAAVAAAPLALADAVLSGIALHRACQDYQASRQALAEQAPGMARFDAVRFQFEAAEEKVRYLSEAIAAMRREGLSDASQPARTDRAIVTLGHELARAEAEHTRLHRELCGLAPDAQHAANARVEAAESGVSLVEASVNAARGGTGLVASGMQAWQGGLELAGQAASSGFQSATNALGYVSGGLAVVTGGVAVGLAAYRLHKADQSKAQIQAALSSAKDKSNDELISKVGEHAIARKDQARRRSMLDIFKNSLSVAGGVIGLVTLTATGVGALVLGATALGLGMTVLCVSVGQLMAQRRDGRQDQALRAQVEDAPSRQQLLETIKAAITDALTQDPDGNEAFDIESAARLMLAARNPYFAVHLLAEQIERPAEDPEHQQAITFLRDAGMTEAEQQRLSMLLGDPASDASRQLALGALETFLLG